MDDLEALKKRREILREIAELQKHFMKGDVKGTLTYAYDAGLAAGLAYALALMDGTSYQHLIEFIPERSKA